MELNRDLWCSAVGVLTLVALICITVIIRQQSTRIEMLQERIESDRFASSAAENFLVNERFFAEKIFCASSAEAPLCKAISTKTYSNLGEHPPLWVLFDAIAAALKSPSQFDSEFQQQFLYDYTGMVVALERHTVLSGLMAKDGDHVVYANDLYAATLAHARVCALGLNTTTCKDSLPVDLSVSLGAIGRLFLSINPAEQPLYDGVDKREGVRDVLAAGLL